MIALGDSFLDLFACPQVLKLAPKRLLAAADQSTDTILLPACPFRLSP